MNRKIISLLLMVGLCTARNFISKAKSETISRLKEQYALKLRILDCADLYKRGYNESGVYALQPANKSFSTKRVNVYCDMTTDGGGWTVIQRRGDFKREDDYFDKNWQEYKTGFGSITKDFWLGNDNIFTLTNQKFCSVRFDLEDKEHNKIYTVYDRFWIDDESKNYTLHISDYSGTAGNDMKIYDTRKFSTKDRDNDMNPSKHCAKLYSSGWWFNYFCYNSNLNGRYNNETHGIMWKNLRILKSEIKIRPIFF